MSYRLDNKVAIVTGAGRGIGRAITEGYAAAGASVCCVARTATEIQAVAESVRRCGGRAISVVADVRNPTSVGLAFEEAAQTFGGVDIVVINAGINTARSTIEESEIERWRETMDTNLLGAYYCAKAAIPHLKKRGTGKIITIGSGLGHKGLPGTCAYAVSKAGLWMLTRVLAQELASYNISVNELIPGPVETSVGTTPIAGFTSAVAEMEWVKSPTDVIPLALFLASQPDRGPTAQSYSLMRRDS